MLATKSHESDKSNTGSAPDKTRGEQQTPAPEVKLNPLWSNLATHVTSRAAAGASGDPPPIQRMCAECEEDMNSGNPPSLQMALGNRFSQSASTTPPIRRQLNNPEEDQAEFPVQAKLTIGAPDDEYEQEADRVADQVLRMPEPTNPDEESAQIGLQANQQLLSRNVSLQGGSDHGSTTRVNPTIAADIHSLNGRGNPLPLSTRSFFEPRFGADFSNVRVHTDTRSAETAASINAKAFTVGKNIAFGNGQYAPESNEGRRLLAHELTHTIQQSHNSQRVHRNILGDLIGQGADLVTSGVANLGEMLGIPPLTELGPALLNRILGLISHPLVGYLPGFSTFQSTARMLEGFSALLETAWDIYQDPSPYVNAIKEKLGQMVITSSDAASTTATAVVSNEYVDCIMRHLTPKIDYMLANWWPILKEMGWELLWPWPGVAEDFSVIWDKIQSLGSNVWNLEFSRATDDLLSILRHLNAAAGRLYGWFAIGAILVGAILGGIGGAAAGGVGAVPGAIAGAGSGLALAGDVGLVLLATTVAIEGASILKAAYNLSRDDRTDAEKECDCELISNSSLIVGISVAMAVLGGIAGRFAKAIIQRIGRRVWRLPSRRPAGRQSTRTRRLREQAGEEVGPTRESRGDVLEARFSLAEHARNVFNRARVKLLDTFSTADNFPGIDLTSDSTITIRSQTTGQVLSDVPAFDAAITAGETLQVVVEGGHIFQVKSHGPSTNLLQTITREIQSTGRFNSGTLWQGRRGHNVVVQNPTSRTLVVFLEEALPATDLARLQATARTNGVRLQIVTEAYPPGHPAIIPPEALPGLFSQLGSTGMRAAEEEGEIGETVECEL